MTRHARGGQCVRREYDEAAALLRRAVECDPENPAVLFRQGNLMHFSLRDYAGAEKAYLRLLSHPALPGQLRTDALANYGLLLCNCLRRYGAAHRVLERVLEMAPDHGEARLGFKCAPAPPRAPSVPARGLSWAGRVRQVLPVAGGEGAVAAAGGRQRGGRGGQRAPHLPLARRGAARVRLRRARCGRGCGAQGGTK